MATSRFGIIVIVNYIKVSEQCFLYKMTEQRIDNTRMLDLTDDDLRENPHKYSEAQLLYTLQTYVPSLRVLNCHQTLSAYICAKYVIFGGNDEKYGDCCEDRWLDDNDILRRQPHITSEELRQARAFVEEEEENEQRELDDMANEDNTVRK